MIAYTNKDNTTRIIKSFRDRIGKDVYYLQHRCGGFKLFGITIIRDWWRDGCNPHAGVPPYSTIDMEVVGSWIEQYKLEKVEDV